MALRHRGSFPNSDATSRASARTRPASAAPCTSVSRAVTPRRACSGVGVPRLRNSGESARSLVSGASYERMRSALYSAAPATDSSCSARLSAAAILWFTSSIRSRSDAVCDSRYSGVAFSASSFALSASSSTSRPELVPSDAVRRSWSLSDCTASRAARTCVPVSASTTLFTPRNSRMLSQYAWSRDSSEPPAARWMLCTATRTPNGTANPTASAVSWSQPGFRLENAFVTLFRTSPFSRPTTSGPNPWNSVDLSSRPNSPFTKSLYRSSSISSTIPSYPARLSQLVICSGPNLWRAM